ncbi:MAG TPA: YbhB/YbcL family Raf kinase inhibitor-like protein [Acidimicrobiales bacterium]
MKRLAAAIACAIALVACSNDGRELRPPGPDQTLSIITTSSAPSTTVPPPVSGDGPSTSEADPGQELGFTLTLPFGDGQDIPRRHTCDGADVAPQVTWANVPDGAVELALTVVDLDSNPSGFVHWAITGLDPATPGIAEGKVPAGAAQAVNGFDFVGYKGPCPADGTHTYLYTVYALSEPSGIVDGAPAAEVLSVINEKLIASAASAGVYPSA